jgi:hypothetical protein
LLEVRSELVDEVLAYIKLCVEVLDLKGAILARFTHFCQLAELAGQVAKHKREYCHADHYDDHAPKELEAVHRDDVAVAYSAARDDGPVKRSNVNFEDAGVKEAGSTEPITVVVEVETRGEAPQATRNVKQKDHRVTCEENLLGLHPERQLFEAVSYVVDYPPNPQNFRQQNHPIEPLNRSPVQCHEIQKIIFAIWPVR